MGQNQTFFDLATPKTKQTVWLPAGALTPATTNGPASAQVESSSNKINYMVLDFDGTTQENAHFSIGFPPSWDRMQVSFRAFWESTATDTDGVAWGLQAVSLADGDTVDAAYGTGVVVLDSAQGATGKRYITVESFPITIAGAPGPNEQVHFRLYRDPNNTFDVHAEDARLVGIDLFYWTNVNTDA